MEYKELIENLEAEKTNIHNAFSGEGAAIRTKEANLEKLVEATQFIEDIKTGTKPSYLFKEAMSTSDFPILFGQIIDRQLLGGYKALTPVWSAFVGTQTVRDFRTVDRYYIDGAQGQIDEVEELAEYKARAVSEGKYQFSVKKYGAVMPISWETRINDDLGALEDWPSRLVTGASRTEQKLVTAQYVDSNGWHDSLYDTAGTYANVISGNPALTTESLADGVFQLKNQTDTDGEPVFIEEAVLVVGPALEQTARRILDMTQIEITEGTNKLYVAGNGLGINLKLVVDPYIPIIATSNGTTSWFIFASAASSDRSALVVGKLRGHESPELFMQAPNAVSISGGSVNPIDGDFKTDSINYKVRFVVGAARMNGNMTVASNGSGS